MESTTEGYSLSRQDRRWLKFLNLSINYAEIFGFRTFPLIHKRQPAIAWKFITQLRIFDTKASMAVFDYAARKVNGLAVIVGPISNRLAVRDFDTEQGFEQWRSAHPLIAPRCFIARTRRGYHVYFRLPEGHGPIYRKMPDGELLGDNRHYVPLPPSLHSEKLRYRWVDDREPMSTADLPELDPVVAGFVPAMPPEKAPATAKINSSFLEKESDSAGVVSVRSTHTPQPMSLCATVLKNGLRLEPDGLGQRNQCLWNLVRSLKADPALRKLEQPCEAVLSLVREWHKKHLDVIGTKEFAETWSDFERQWVLAYSPIRSAEGVPANAPELPLSGLCNRYQDRQIRDILKFAAKLCKGRVGIDFPLSSRFVEKEIRIPYRSACRKLDRLVKDGVLELVTFYKWKGEGTKASEYRFTRAALDQSQS